MEKDKLKTNIIPIKEATDGGVSSPVKDIEKIHDILKKYNNPKITEDFCKLISSVLDVPEKEIPDPIKKLRDKMKVLENLIPIDKVQGFSPGWLIKGWLHDAGLSIITGDKASGKSRIGFALIHLLTRLKQDTPFGPLGGGKAWAYLYFERAGASHRDRWNALGGLPEKLSIWPYNPKEKKSWNTLESLENVLKLDEIGGVFIDRGDLFIKYNTKKEVRDVLRAIDELGIKYKKPIIMSRHTSKPQGRDGRQFKDQTDGFKEWQHTATICKYVFKHGDKVFLCKQYSNESTTDGLIEFQWKMGKNNVAMLELSSYDPDITLAEIEKKYNPRSVVNTVQQTKSSDTLYNIFSKHGLKSTVCRSGSTIEEKVFTLTKEQLESFVKSYNLNYHTTKNQLRDKLNGFCLGSKKKKDISWHCPIRD